MSETTAVMAGVSFPLNRMYLEFTNYCNMACTFCPYPLQTRKQGIMEYDLLKRVVTDLTRNNITKTIEIRGYGEPLMHPEWYKFTKHIIDSGLKVNITTNGLLLSQSASEKLSELQIDDLIISLQTPDEESFKIRKASMKFESYVERLKKSIDIITTRNPNCHIRLRFLNTLGTKYMSFPETVSSLNSKEELISSIKDWVEIIYDIMGLRFDNKKVSNELNRVAKLQPTMIHVNNNITLESYLCNDFWAYGVKDQIKFPTKHARCRSMGLDSTLIYWNGDITFCCSDFNNYLNIGSLQRQSVMEALASKKAIALINGFKKFQVNHPYCQNCLGGKSLFLSLTKAVASSLYMSNLKEFEEIILTPEKL